jgi:catecholate siderophore receptor
LALVFYSTLLDKNMNRLTPIAAALVATFAAPLPLLRNSCAALHPPRHFCASGSNQLAPVTVEGRRDDFASTGTAISKLPADLHDVPQSVTVVNKAQMQSQA